MGNIVSGEALRIWTFELPLNDDPLVTTYVAMQAAVSAGAYGSNGTDSLFPGRPEPDLYRFWSHGQDDGLTNPNLGTSYYFQGTGFASENTVNMYNQADFALLAWDGNNILKEAVDEFIDPFEDPYFPWTSWPLGYLWESGPDQNSNVNDDTFERYNPDETLNATLTLTNVQGRPGINAYEIMAFFSQSADTALGTKSVNFFDTNIDIQTYGLLGGNGIRANHSYEFNHDAAETWSFYSALKAETGFGATHSAIAASFESALIEDKNPVTAQSDFQPLLLETKNLHPQSTARAEVFREIGYTNRSEQLSLLLSDEVLKSLEGHITTGVNDFPERDDQALDQDDKDAFFGEISSDVAQSQLTIDLEGDRFSL